MMIRSSFPVRAAISAVCLCLASAACAGQQLPPAATAPVAAESPSKGPALWKVADEDTTIYLFGTVHALPKDVDWFTGNIADALASSDALVTEIYVPKGSEAQMAATFNSRGKLPDGASLRDILKPEDTAQLEAALTKLKIPVGVFDSYEPWYAAVNLSLIPLFQAGYSSGSGVESVIAEKAGDLPRIELESVEQQVDMLDGLPLEVQEKYLASIAQEIDTIVPTLNQIVADWAVGDTRGLDTLMNVDYDDPVLNDRMYVTRNRNWAEWIDARMDQPGTIFIAVGAGHLAGDTSVQTVLAQRGIIAMRVQ